MSPLLSISVERGRSAGRPFSRYDSGGLRFDSGPDSVSAFCCPKRDRCPRKRFGRNALSPATTPAPVPARSQSRRVSSGMFPAAGPTAAQADSTERSADPASRDALDRSEFRRTSRACIVSAFRVGSHRRVMRGRCCTTAGQDIRSAGPRGSANHPYRISELSGLGRSCRL